MQHFDLQRESADNNYATVFVSSELGWVASSDLGQFNSLRSSNCRKWVQACSDVEGCIDLSDPVQAVPPHALDNWACPLIFVVEELLRRGWKHQKRKVMHDAGNHALMIMDGRNALTKKAYFQLLLKLPGACFSAKGSFIWGVRALQHHNTTALQAYGRTCLPDSL